MNADRLAPGTYFGATTMHFQGSGLALAETSFAADLLIPEHEHVNPFFCFVLAGRGMRTWPARAGAQAPMTLTLFPAGVPHANCWHGAGGRALHVEFEPAWREQRSEQVKLLSNPRDFAGGAPVWLAQRLAAECHQQDAVTPLALEGLVLELLAACTRSSMPGATLRVPRWLERARELLHAQFADTLTFAQIAATVGISADHLAREFRRHHGCTVGEYVRRLRVDFACHQLARGDQTLTAIAAAAGFADQSHLTRVFRRMLGMTPSSYRALHDKSRFRSRP